MYRLDGKTKLCGFYASAASAHGEFIRHGPRVRAIRALSTRGENNAMSILLIRSPEEIQDCQYPAPPIPKEVRASLVERAAMAGKTISVRACQSDSDVAACLRHIQASSVEFVLFDPGKCERINEAVCTALKELEVPYIEVHDDNCGALESSINPKYGPFVTEVHGYGAQSYTLALSIALERMGYAECENDYHVGT
jgi:3-dehydroquinate dehydratase